MFGYTSNATATSNHAAAAPRRAAAAPAASSMPATISVIDPCNRTGKITIPMEYVTETRGVLDHLRYAANPNSAPPAVKDLSLCLLHQKGRCNAGHRCNQVHVDPEFVQHVRAHAAATKSCCARHGDAHSASLSADVTAVLVHDDGREVPYSLIDFARTTGLDNIMRRWNQTGGQLRIPASRLCRLCQRGCCKFGKDCKNVHICPQAVPLEAGGAPATATPPLAPLQPVKTQATPPPLTSWSSRSSSNGSSCDASYVSVSNDSSFAAATLGISSRCCPCPPAHMSQTAAAAPPTLETSCTLKALDVSALTASDGCFQSIRYDPLEIPTLEDGDDSDDVGASSVTDFEAFVDALVDCGTSPMASPQWVVAP